MLYLKAAEGDVKVIVLETKNLKEIRLGKPAKTPDGSVLIAWTPDPVWLADKIMETGGDAVEIGRLIDEAAKRTQKPEDRPSHEIYTKSFLEG